MNEETETRLDALLAAPLAPVADSGFSARVMSRIARERQFAWVESGALAVLGLLLLFILPFQALGDLMVRVSDEAADSTPLAAATLAIVLSLFWLRLAADD